MQILYNDKNITVCIKPRGVLSQSTADGNNTMPDLLKAALGGEFYPIHRLDREVGGVTVYAKTRNAAAELSRAVAQRSLLKEYTALVHGKPQSESGEMHDLLFKDSEKNKSYVVKRERKGVKSASLEYKLESSFVSDGEEYSQLKIRLHTGRTHQIRVQLSSRGMPICGDRKYGAKDSFDTIHLWSHKIAFNHPVTGEALEFTQESDWEAQGCDTLYFNSPAK